MEAIQQVQSMFHLTGRGPQPPLEAVDGLGLRPALLSRYRDLGRLRYDFPLVLVDAAPGEPFALPLTDLVNDLVRRTVPAGPGGEAMRKHLIHVERDIRRSVAEGRRGRLSGLWEAAVTARGPELAPELEELLRRAGTELAADGEVVDCDESLPETLMVHAWRVVQREKLARAREDINRLIVKLSDILRADYIHSAEGQKPDSLRAAVGTRQQGLFNFDTMAGLLARGRPRPGLGERRRERIESVLAVLRAQRFFPDPLVEGTAPADAHPYEFRFDSCRSVQEAYTRRLPEMAALVRAMSIAELEVDGRYDESHHDAFFDAFDADAVSRQDLGIFPDYLACLRGRARAEAADVNLMELLSSGIPVKVLVEVDDLLEEAAVSEAHFTFGVRSVQLASLAMALNDAFVLQSTSSNLPQLTGALRRGLSTPAPALFSVYTATAAHSGDLPRYLVSAAAMQSRAFPAFTYDPSAGPDMASRFSLQDNPQPLNDWARASFEYADSSMQRITVDLAFTLADFVAADPRYAGHFARVPHEKWEDTQVLLSDWLQRGEAAEGEAPCLLAVDEDDVLHRLVVDEKLVQATRRCLENWHRLQEMGGVHNSHAEALLAKERAAWEEEKRREIDALSAASAPAGAEAAAQAPPADASPVEAPQAEPEIEEEPEHSPDEAWIETVRCSSCNECTQINSEMFAYNENQQAYIKDLKAGSYRQLVEAAESCQLSIIHPGKPWDANEPGLEELVERARPFI